MRYSQNTENEGEVALSSALTLRIYRLTFSSENERGDKPIKIIIQMDSPTQTGDIGPYSNDIEEEHRKDMSFRPSSKEAKEGESEC